MSTMEINYGEIRELTDEEIDMVSGGWDTQAAINGAYIGGVAGGVGGAITGAIAGPAAAAGFVGGFIGGAITGFIAGGLSDLSNQKVANTQL